MDDVVGHTGPRGIGTVEEDETRSATGRSAADATDIVGGTSSPADAPPRHDGPHLGPYPVRLPKLRDPRLHLATVTMTLQVLGQTVFNFDLSIAQILVSMGTCAAIELAIVFRRTKVIAWPASAMLTGNGIALIMRVPGTEHGDWWSLHGWWVFAGTAALAMATKYLIRIEGRHIFNPSNVALVAVFVALGEARADPQILWWGPWSVGLVLAFVVILAGSVAVTRRVGQGPTALSFLVVFAAGAGILAASGHSIVASWHVGPIAGWTYWWLVVTSPEVLVFLFFMITDPRTSPGGRVGRIVYGSGIAIVSALIISTQGDEFGTKVGILAGLVVLCAFVRSIDRRTPAAGTQADRLRSWVPTLFVAETAASAQRRRPVGLVIVAVVVGSALFLAVIGSRSDDAVDLGRRDEVSIDAAAVPEVTVEPSLEMTSMQLTPELAAAMGRDVVHSLEIESAALAASDVELAAAGVSGIRLAQVEAAIEAAGGAGVETPERSFDSMTATMLRLDSGPQAPPELALRATGTLTDPSGTEAFEATYLLVNAGGAYLVTNELDAQGDPVGDQRAGSADAIEPAVADDAVVPTASELAGLTFRDVTAEVGLDSARSATALREGPAAMSGGVAVGDVTGDGRPDVFLTRVGQPNALYRNDGETFTDITAEAGLDTADAGQGSTAATFVDIDADGNLDLVVLGLGTTPNRLYLGSGDGRFVDATEAWGLPTEAPGGPDSGSFGLSAGDYDGDGLVDLVIVDADPYALDAAMVDADLDGGDPCSADARSARRAASPAPTRTRLLRNTGTGFEDRTASLGVDPAGIVAMTPQFADLTGNGSTDLLITGHNCTTTLLVNNGDGTFGDATEGSGFDRVETASGAEIFDADGDGRLDVFLTGVSYPTASGECPLQDVSLGCSGNRLFLAGDAGSFTDVTDARGVRDGFWAWGATAADLTGDGREDLLVSTGHRTVSTERAATRDDGSFYERSAETPERLWLNTGDGPWPDAASAVGLDLAANAKAIVSFDQNRNGRLDVLVITTDGSPVLYRNETAGEHNWLAVTLADSTGANRHGVGATVTAELGEGRQLVRRLSSTGSFQSGRPAEVHFGLGSDPVVERLVVRWPDGVEQELTGVEAGQVLEVRR